MADERLLAACDAVLAVWKGGLFKHGMFDGRNLAFDELEEIVELHRKFRKNVKWADGSDGNGPGPMARWAEKWISDKIEQTAPSRPPNQHWELTGVTDKDEP